MSDLPYESTARRTHEDSAFDKNAPSQPARKKPTEAEKHAKLKKLDATPAGWLSSQTPARGRPRAQPSLPAGAGDCAGKRAPSAGAAALSRRAAAVACAAAAAQHGASAAEARVLGRLGRRLYELTEDRIDLVLAMPGSRRPTPAHASWYTSAQESSFDRL